jgi:hypothetical protein
MPERWTPGRPIDPPPYSRRSAGEHGLREQLDVLRREGQAAELKPHEHAGAQLLHVGANLAGDVVGNPKKGVLCSGAPVSDKEPLPQHGA